MFRKYDSISDGEDSSSSVDGGGSVELHAAAAAAASEPPTKPQQQQQQQQCENDVETVTESVSDENSITSSSRSRDDETMRLIAGVAGNILEWYDFAIFGYFGDVIGDVFFPPQAGHAAMVESYVVFGGAFIMRPVGGALMGWIGDKYGRKTALELSVFLMAFPTFAMGCLPSYESVGSWAFVALALVRLLQGLSCGGQLVSSLVFTVEGRPKSQWGLYGSYVMATANLGTLLGGIIGFVMRATLDHDQLRSWGWRLPFLSGILVSLSGVYLRLYCEEDEIPGHEGGSRDAVAAKNPMREAFRRENLRSLLSSALVPTLWSGGFYLTFVWMAIFMGDLQDPPIKGAFAINSLSLLLSVCLLFPVAGMLSDKYGRKPVMTIGGLGMGILSPVMVMIIGTGDPVAAFFAQSVMGISLCLWGAPMCAWLVEAFPPHARLTSVGIGYNIAQATVGGFAPALATVFVDRYGDKSPGFVLTAIAVLALTGLLVVYPGSAEECGGGKEAGKGQRTEEAGEGSAYCKKIWRSPPSKVLCFWGLK